MSVRDFFHTVATGGAAVGLTLVNGPLASLAAIRDPKWADPFARSWGRGILAAAGVKPVVEGLEKLPARTAIYVANHQSNFDVPLIFSEVPRHIRFVAKAELYRIPVLGSAIRAIGNIKVDRRGSEKDRETMAQAVQSVRERVSILFFAEGTRSEDGVLRPFKKGAFILALQAGVPIVPLAISGTRHILPKGGKWVRGGQRAALVIGDPIPTEGMKVDDRESLMAKTHAAVAKLYDRANQLVEAK